MSCNHQKVTAESGLRLPRPAPYPSPRFVVLQVHEHTALLLRPLGIVLLPLPGIHKLLGKAVAVLHIVPTAAPQPVPGQVLGPCCPAAPTRGELTLAASPADGIDHACSAHSIGESSLTAACKTERKGVVREVTLLCPTAPGWEPAARGALLSAWLNKFPFKVCGSYSFSPWPYRTHRWWPRSALPNHRAGGSIQLVHVLMQCRSGGGDLMEGQRVSRNSWTRQD